MRIVDRRSGRRRPGGSSALRPASAAPGRGAAPKLVVLLVVDQMRTDYVDAVPEGLDGRAQADPGHRGRVVFERRISLPHDLHVRRARHHRHGRVSPIATVCSRTRGSIAAAGRIGDVHRRSQRRRTSATSTARPAATARVSLRLPTLGRRAAAPAGRACRHDGAQGTERHHDGRARRPRGHVAERRAPAWLRDLDGLRQRARPERQGIHRRESDRARTSARSGIGCFRSRAIRRPTTAKAKRHREGGRPPSRTRCGPDDAAVHDQWEMSPYADDVPRADGRWRSSMPRRSVSATTTDLLAVSFSSPDLLGHAFGPHSQEIQDMYLRLDRTIGTLLDALDAKVGRGRYVVGLGSDHGVSDMPEQARSRGPGRGPPQQRAADVDRRRRDADGLRPGQLRGTAGVERPVLRAEGVREAAGQLQRAGTDRQDHPGAAGNRGGVQQRGARATRRASTIRGGERRRSATSRVAAAISGWRSSPGGCSRPPAPPTDRRTRTISACR